MARTPEQNNAIITGNIPRQLLLFFFPIWLGTMFQQLYNTVDTLIVGNFVGTQALAAVGATSSFVQLLVGLFVGLCSGAGVIIAQSFGAGDHDEVNRQVHTALALAIAGGYRIRPYGECRFQRRGAFYMRPSTGSPLRADTGPAPTKSAGENHSV